jgi:N-acetylglucosamine kinase-like BadF-type ATPase
MTNYFLGVDIGGTKSHALIADERGTALGFSIGGPGNYEGVGYEGLVGTIQTIIQQALDAAGIDKGSLSGAGFGVAGYDWPSERRLILAAVDTLGLTCPLEVVNDTIIGLLAGTNEGWGVAVVAGTGENCWGWNRARQMGRVTGNGSWLGEYGGAGTVVYKAVQEVSKAWSLRGPETALTQAFINRTGATGEADLLEGLSVGKYVMSADDAPLVIKIAESGDPVAQNILRWAGLELAELIKGVIRQLQFEEELFEVVLVGSMFKVGRLLINPMCEAVCKLAPGAQFVHLDAPPVVGGVLLGMECAGKDGYLIKANLVNTTIKLFTALQENKINVP